MQARLRVCVMGPASVPAHLRVCSMGSVHNLCLRVCVMASGRMDTEGVMCVSVCVSECVSVCVMASGRLGTEGVSCVCRSVCQCVMASGRLGTKGSALLGLGSEGASVPWPGYRGCLDTTGRCAPWPWYTGRMCVVPMLAPCVYALDLVYVCWLPLCVHVLAPSLLLRVLAPLSLLCASSCARVLSPCLPLPSPAVPLRASFLLVPPCVLDLVYPSCLPCPLLPWSLLPCPSVSWSLPWPFHPGPFRCLPWSLLPWPWSLIPWPLHPVLFRCLPWPLPCACLILCA